MLPRSSSDRRNELALALMLSNVAKLLLCAGPTPTPLSSVNAGRLFLPYTGLVRPVFMELRHGVDADMPIEVAGRGKGVVVRLKSGIGDVTLACSLHGKERI